MCWRHKMTNEKLLWQLIDNLLPVRSDRWSADVTRRRTRGMGWGECFVFHWCVGNFARVSKHTAWSTDRMTHDTPCGLVKLVTAMCRQTMCRWVATVCNVCMFVPVCMACGVSCVYICVAACVVWVYALVRWYSPDNCKGHNNSNVLHFGNSGLHFLFLQEMYDFNAIFGRNTRFWRGFFWTVKKSTVHAFMWTTATCL